MLDAPIDALWAKVLDGWDDDAQHAAFLEHCRTLGILPQAAARYRKERDASDDGARRERCDKALGRIAALAMMDLDASRSAEPPSDITFAHRVIRWAVLLIFLGALFVLVFSLAR
ncbi:MAG: hypothetical protein U0359_21445 [Byssovorax sp.]